MGQPIQGKATQFVRTPEQVARDAAIAEYIADGHTRKEACAEFGMSRQGIHDAYWRAVADVPRAGGEKALKIELAKLDAIEAAAWTVLEENHIYVADGRVVRDKDNENATVTDHKPVLMAIDRILKIGDQRAKLLGLYAPVKQTVTVITEDVVDAELRRLEQELADRGEPVPHVEP